MKGRKRRSGGRTREKRRKERWRQGWRERRKEAGREEKNGIIQYVFLSIQVEASFLTGSNYFKFNKYLWSPYHMQGIVMKNQ